VVVYFFASLPFLSVSILTPTFSLVCCQISDVVELQVDELQRRMLLRNEIGVLRVYGPPEAPILGGLEDPWYLPRGETQENITARVTALLRPPEQRKKKKSLYSSSSNTKLGKYNYTDNELLLDQSGDKMRKKKYNNLNGDEDEDDDRLKKKSKNVKALDERERDKRRKDFSKQSRLEQQKMDLKNKRASNMISIRKRTGQQPLSEEGMLVTSWSLDEDRTLLESVREYGTNWDLVADVINTTLLSNSRKFYKTRRMCHDRWMVIKDTSIPASLESNSSSSSSSSSTSSSAILDLLKRCKKKLPARLVGPGEF
jgi:hypothetical protein